MDRRHGNRDRTRVRQRWKPLCRRSQRNHFQNRAGPRNFCLRYSGAFGRRVSHGVQSHRRPFRLRPHHFKLRPSFPDHASGRSERLFPRPRQTTRDRVRPARQSLRGGFYRGQARHRAAHAESRGRTGSKRRQYCRARVDAVAPRDDRNKFRPLLPRLGRRRATLKRLISERLIHLMRAEIIAVGSELLTAQRLDTNSLFLTAELNRLGIRVVHKAVVGDGPEEMTSSFRHALDRADLVISSGGLGPTDDDRTRTTVSQLLGRKLQLNDEILRHIQERFCRYNRPMPEINARQAMVPEGATILPNPRGTAPGLWIEANGRIVVLLPGVPTELRALFEVEVKPRLARVAPPERLFARELRITGLPESEVESRVRPLYPLYPDVE